MFTQVSDLSPLVKCKNLKLVAAGSCGKLTPAAIAAFQEARPDCKIEWDDPAKVTTPKSAASSKLFMHDPAFPAWMAEVQAMPAEKQIEACVEKASRTQSWFDGKLAGPRFGGTDKPTIENGVVTEIGFSGEQVRISRPFEP